MVGVPGKSKGCNTCRRRKLGCDLGKPSCNRCIQSRRICEGYERYPTFLNRTTQGLERRKRLEEVKSRPTITVESSAAASSRGQEQACINPPVAHHRRPSPLGQPDHAQAFDQQTFATFLEVYCPSTHVARTDRPRSWFQMVPDMQTPGKALSYGSKAFAASRVAFAYNDASMRFRAFDAYGKALRELQKALWDPKRMYRDETLLATRALVTFELFEATSNSMRSWNSHESGSARLVQLRGAQSYQAPLPRRILEDMRFSSMIQAIQYRKANFLGSEEWTTVPWANSPKDVRQRLHDIGFQIAATMERTDRLAEMQNRNERALTFSQTLMEFSQIDSRLNVWYEELCREYEVLYWTQLPEDGHAPSPNNPFYMEEILFPNTDIAWVVNLFWALKLVTSLVVNQMCVRFMAEAQPKPASPSRSSHATETTSRDPSPLPSRTSSTPSIPPQLIQLVQSMARTHDAQHRFSLASNIIRSMPYFLGDNMGLMAAHLILFQCRVAQYELEESKAGVDFLPQDTSQGPSAPAQEADASLKTKRETLLRSFKVLYDRLVEVKGVGYARQVGRTGNRWGRPMPSDVDKKIESGQVDPTRQSDTQCNSPGQYRCPEQQTRSDSDSEGSGSYSIVQRQARSERPVFTSPILEKNGARQYMGTYVALPGYQGHQPQ